MGGMIVWSAFREPVVLAVLFGTIACLVIAWTTNVAAKRTGEAGRSRWSRTARIATWAFSTLALLHLCTAATAVREVDASGYSLVLTTIQAKPEMVPSFRRAMADGRMTVVEYWDVRRHGGLVTTDDMRDVSTRISRSLDGRRP